MKSFSLNAAERTHWTGILLGWSAFIGLCTVVGVHLWIQVSRDRGWFLAPDPNPDHWTRSHVLNLLAGTSAGLVAGGIQLLIRRLRSRA